MLVDFDPSPELEQAAQRAMVCAPHACEREIHCARMAMAMRDLFRQAYTKGWTGRAETAAGPATMLRPSTLEFAAERAWRYGYEPGYRQSVAISQHWKMRFPDGSWIVMERGSTHPVCLAPDDNWISHGG